MAKARATLDKANISTPVKLTLHYTTDHYGPATAKEFDVLKQQLNASGLFDISVEGTTWDKFRPAEIKGQYDVYGMGWFPTSRTRTTTSRRSSTRTTPRSPSQQQRDPNSLIPASRREADRLTASKSLTDIQDIVAEEVPILPLWQGKQYVATRDDIRAASTR